ncbi:MAG TPA: nuclear transport factor 2 family protein [Salegentibacter sp.]|uniref:nuclear transport factor 2 family protein n=1 Tax=Salegentibacter sp. TaxID=1903072 RepID=UPI002F9204BE
MKNLVSIILFGLLSLQTFSQDTSEEKINQLIDQWHKAAAEADFDAYFSLMTQDGVFIGTDATENWQNDDFREFSKPYFDRGKAWSFTRLERNIYFNKNKSIAWFDELLDTHMGICRGSGVLQKTETEWKIAHYVLSITIPNENVEKVTQLKQSFDEKLISQHKNK